ncbi:hypothetical protein CRG98_003765 [Punica granatum]|uniref:Aminotransferase-like plant mobile domain-containing protein n=1 Tax=Punica granatum TaxID=22663 RepID=A0A2I0L5F3_PUNGR|nr:hypothetical protein CRG98_003765 [Punica granatum]
MDRSHPCLRLDVIVTPAADIMRLWRTFHPVDRAFLRLIIIDLPLLADSLIDRTLLRTAISFWDTQRAMSSSQETELAPTVEEYAALIQLPMPTRDIVVPNQGEPYQRDTCHGFLLLIFETILFLYLSNLIDGALAQVIFQVVGGHSYVEAVLVETIRSLDYIWLLAHIRPFCSSDLFSYITDECSLIARLLQVFRPFDRDYIDWKQFMEGLTPAQFLWAARWNLGGPMTIGCPSVTGLPLISHLGSTLIFLARVIRQLGGLQDISTEADHASYRFMWADTIASLPDRFLWVREVRRLWGTHIVHELYFPEHPTNDERAFSTTAAYVAQFHSQGLTPVRRLRTSRIPHTMQADIPDTESSVQGAMRTELQSIREERDRLRCELVDTRLELTDHKELQRERAQTRARVANQDREIARLSATLDRARAKNAFRRPYRTSSTNSTDGVQPCGFRMFHRTRRDGEPVGDQHGHQHDRAHGYVQGSESSFTPPPEHKSIVNANPTVPLIFVSEVEDASFSAMAYAPMVHSISDPLLPPPAPTAVPLPPATFLSADSTMHTLPPLTVSMHPLIYTVPPPTVPPVTITQAPVPTANQFPFQAPQSQISFYYPAPPPLNIPPTKPGMPTQATPPALRTNIPPEAENEQERRIRRMEETI